MSVNDSRTGTGSWLPCAGRLVGRAYEVDRIDRLRRSVEETGAGRLVLVTGEAGVGKSRLVAEVAAAARTHGVAVLTGRSVPDSDAFRPLEEALAGALRHRSIPADPALRPYLPALAHLLPAFLASGTTPAATSRVMIAEGTLQLLAAITGGRGAVLVLEDLQWADPDTLDVLSYLCHAADGSRLLILCTARDDTDLPERLLALTASCSAPLVHLARLRREDVSDMLSSCMDGPPPPELLDFMLEHADGIPFLVEELLRGMAAAGALDASGRLRGPVQPGVPRTFAATVRRRLDAMAPAERQVVEVAAVLGRRFDWRRIPQALGMTPAQVLSALRTLVSTGLVEAEDEDTFRFRHALSRDAVLGELLPPERAALTRAVAQVVEQAEESGDLAAALWAAAGEGARAARLYIRAGGSARRRGALHTAERSMRRAAALAGDPVDLATAEHGLLDVLAASGDTEQALSLGARLLAAGDESVRLTLAEVAATAGRRDSARAWLADLPEDGSPRGSVLIARIAHEEGRPDDAREAAHRALAAARAAGLWSVACEALRVIGRADRVSDPAAARRAFAAAEQLATEHQLPVERISALHELGTIDLLVDGSTELLQRARALAEEAGMLGTAATLDVQLAAALTHRDPDGALVHAVRSAELARRLRMDRLRATALMFAAAVYAGRHDTIAMEREVRTALALAPDDLDVNAGIWGAVRAHVALLDNDRDELARCLDTAMGFLRRSPTTTPAPTRGLWALVRTLAGDDGAARDEARPSDVNWQNAALLDYADAVAYGRAGQPAEAERAFGAADAAMARLPWWRHRVRLLIADAAHEDGWGEPTAWVREAMPVFTGRHEAALVAACRTYLRTAGEPVPRAARGTAVVPADLTGAGVTGREMEVLHLAVQGHNDAEIARRLFLSPRTVETHMRNLRDKTASPSRQALIDRAKSGLAKR